MANRVLINDLPKHPVCSISELVNGTPSQHSQPHQDHLNRRIVKLPNGREILIVLHPITNEVFAMDRFCYHHGYPLENGDIEDIAAFETMNDNTKKDENEIAKNNARRGEGQVIPRQKGPLKFNKEEHLKAMSKSLQSQQNTSAATNSATKETSPSTSNDVDYKSIQPGQLEVDFEDPSKFQSDDSAYFPIITCTLHNRIFDFRTGDMISRSVVRKTVNKEGKEVPEDDEAAAGEQKCLISESTGCHQRIHPISIERENNNSDKDDNDNNNNNHDGVIFFHDTFGYSVPMRRPGSKVNMEDRSHLMFLAKKKVLSDKENKEINVEKKAEVK